MSPEPGPVDRAAVEAASAVLGDTLRRTPTLRVDEAFLKLELLQHTGSFKPRGALYRARTSDVPEVGLIAASGGNHGLAVAWAANQLGVPAEIFVPEISSPTKIAKLRTYGATVNIGGARYDDALAACRTRQAETGALDIHAYDHPDTIAGAGTVASEFEHQVGTLDTVLVSLGGGGLASGVAAWFLDTATTVVTVEPVTSQCYAAAVEAGRPVDVTVDGVAADSLGARRVGDAPWRQLQAVDAKPILVTDDDIRSAQRRFWAELQLVVEPGGAAAMAALWSGAYVPAEGESVGVIVCGANCDPTTVA